MDVEDTVKMVLIMSGADGGCPYCAHALYGDSIRAWPAVDWQAVLAELRKKTDRPLVGRFEKALREEKLD